MIDIFIPSYHRPNNLKTVNYFLNIGYEPNKIHVFIDSEADDEREYAKIAKEQGFNLHIFDMNEARKRFDYVHRASVSRRLAGQARNMFYEYAKGLGIKTYMVQDDDTVGYEIRPFQRYGNIAEPKDVFYFFSEVEKFIIKHEIGLFGLSQTGDMFAQYDFSLWRKKVMNTTFVNTKFIYRGERGVQDNDTSQFIGIMNEGLFTGSLQSGLVLKQMLSATQAGGLTDLYNECKLLNKSLVVPIQFPSCARAEKQVMNGNRIHHRINYRYLMPKLIKNIGGRDNIAWNTYKEDYPFTNEPKR